MLNYQNYIEKHSIEAFPGLFSNLDPLAKFFVVIPCFNEPDLQETLDSLEACLETKERIQVLVVLNDSDNSLASEKKQNMETILLLEELVKINAYNRFSLAWIYLQNFPSKHFGPGMARKTGMDQVVLWSQENQLDSVIVSLDADTLVEENYFQEIEKFYSENLDAEACSIYFEHPYDEMIYGKEISNSIVQYELYLRYYKLSVQFTGYRNFYHTIGSAFSVRTRSYVKHGGMSKKKAGEDFYFLNKIMPNGYFKELNSTRLMPSPRISDRVVFGTGPAVRDIINSESKVFKTYDYKAFLDLKSFFAKVPLLYSLDSKHVDEILIKYNEVLKAYFDVIDLKAHLGEIQSNVANEKNFIKRFFKWFDPLKILKYLNFAHETHYQKVNVVQASNQFLISNYLNDELVNDPKELLEYFRKIDRFNLLQ